MAIKKVALAVFAVVLFGICSFYVASTFQWAQIWGIVRNVNLFTLLVLGSASIIAYWAIRAVRWHCLIRTLGLKVSFLDVYLCTAISLGLAVVTPLSSGEAFKVELLKKAGVVGRTEGYGSFVVERILDLLTVLLMACISVFWTFNLLPSRKSALYVTGLLIVMAVGGFLVLRKVSLKGPIGKFIECLLECVRDRKTFVTITALTILGWLMVAVSWQVFLLSVGIHLAFGKAIALMSVVALISILSLVPGGLGVSEASVSQVLMRLGYSAASAQSGALILRSYTIVALALGFIHLMVWRSVCARKASANAPVGELSADDRAGA